MRKNNILKPLFFLCVTLLVISFLSQAQATSISSYDSAGIHKLNPVGIVLGTYGLSGGNLSCVAVPNDGKFDYGNNGWLIKFNFSVIPLLDLPLAHIYLEFNVYVQGGFDQQVSVWNGTNNNGVWNNGVNSNWLYETIDISKNLTTQGSLNQIVVGFYGGSGSGNPPIYKLDFVQLDVVAGYEWLKNGGFEDILSQSNVSTSSMPWWCYQSANTLQGITPTNVNVGGWQNYVYFGYKLMDLGVGTGGTPIYQTINFLDSNLVSGVSMWVKKSGLIDIRVDLWYTDGSHSFKTVLLNDTLSSWRFIDFSGFTFKNEIINRFTFTILSGSTMSLSYIDNISLVAGVPAGQSSFSWDIRPDVISRGNNTFRAYQDQNFVFYGSIYANNGSVCGNGNATLTSSLNMTAIKEPIINGSFTIPLYARTSSPKLDFSENLYFKTQNSTIRNCTIILQVTWVKTGTTQDQSTGMITGIIPLIIPIMFLIVPTLLLGVMAGFGGVFVGLLIGVVCLYFGGFIPVWLLYLLGIAMVFLIIFGSGKVSFFGKGKSGDENE